MRVMKRTLLPLLLLLSLLLTACGAPPSGGEEAPWQTAYRQTGEYLLSQETPAAGSVGGDWAVVGLRAAGLLSRETAAVYYESAVTYAAQADGNRLNPNKSTENARTILGVTAAGHSAADVGGVDLTAGLGDMEYLRRQGVNGPIWALIALDSGAYPDPAPAGGASPVTRAALVSEVLSSNGSTSQGSICGSTLALMDAGVPIKAPVAGISCGLITDGDDWMTMVDIQGLEDFYGDMDFKVGGTEKGITAIQVDIKVDGLTLPIIKEAFEKTRKARMYILNEVMLKCIPEPRAELSKYAPKMLTLTIDPEKIREVIGSGGKVIQRICAECNVKIDIEDDGKVFVSGVDIDDARRAVQVIETIANDPEVGALYKGRVTRLMNFGAFVEIAPGKEGLVHISKLDLKRVEKVEDVVTVGDEIIVKVTEIDSQGRINLSRKDALMEIQAKKNKEKE